MKIRAGRVSSRLMALAVAGTILTCVGTVEEHLRALPAMAPAPVSVSSMSSTGAAPAAVPVSMPLSAQLSPAGEATWVAAVAGSAQASAIMILDGGGGPSVSAAAAVLMEARTGALLFGKNADQRREPASITKVMTAIVALERGNLADTVTVSSRAASVAGSSLGLRTGQQMKLEELIRAMMLRSGNDGATAIAEHIGGSVEQFVAMMNARAKSMGLTGTRFANPHGLSATGHYTTARDIAVMCARGLAMPKFADIVGSTELWSSKLRGDEVVGSSVVYNTNKLLWSYQGADGVKTGTTTAAGHCLAASATRDGLQLIAVVLKSGARFNDAARLLDYGFNSFVRLDIADAGQEVAAVLVDSGVSPSVGMAPAGAVQAVVSSSAVGRLNTVIDCPGRPRAPVWAGQRLGWLRVFAGETEIAAYPLYATESVRSRWALWPRRAQP